MIKNRLPLYALCFLAGDVLLQYQQLLPATSVLLILAAVAVVVTFFRQPRWFAFIFFGYIWAAVYGHMYLAYLPSAEISGKDILVSGKVIDLPVNDEKTSRFQLKIETFKLAGYPGHVPAYVRLNWYYPEAAIEPGQHWQLVIRLKPPSGFQNPGGFDYEGWLYQQGIQATGYVRKSQRNQLISTSNESFSFNRLRYRIREQTRSIVESENIPLMQALLIGDRGGINNQTWRSFINTGTSHLMAISGLHIGLVAGFAWFVFRLLMRIPFLSIRITHRHLLILSFSAALFYAGLAGFTIPTQRALLMLATVYLGLFLHRQVSVTQSLSVSLLAVLLISPVSVLSAGFWLSFLAVSVIAYSISGKLPGRQRIMAWFWPQLAVVIMLVPLSLYFFQQSSSLALLANLIAIPMVSLLILPLLLLALGLQFISVTLAGPVYQLADWLITVLQIILDALSGLTFSLWHFPQPGLISMVMALAGMLLLFMPYALPSRWLSLFLFLPLLSNAGQQLGLNNLSGQIELHVLDVGQGLSVFVRTKNHQLLFDTGARFSPRFDAGERVVIPFLRSQGVEKLDVLMISNGDRDHIGGAASVLRELPVKKLIGQDIENLVHPRRELCRAGQHWQWDQVMFEVLHPDESDYQKRNNYSCVLKISNAKGAVLITADIEKKVERLLVKSLRHDLKADVLIVPHHGSKTSSTRNFLQHVKPELAIASAGYQNRYHQPHSEVTGRYQKLGIDLLTTTTSGHISLLLEPSGAITHLTEYRKQYSRYWHRQNASLYQNELSN